VASVICYEKALADMPTVTAMLDGSSSVTAVHLQQMRHRSAALKAIGSVYKAKSLAGKNRRSIIEETGTSALVYSSAGQAYDEIEAMWAQITFRRRAGGEVEQCDALAKLQLVVVSLSRNSILYE
jgi:hypothetical protein